MHALRSALYCPIMPNKSLCEVVTHWCVITQQNTVIHVYSTVCDVHVCIEQGSTGATLEPAMSVDPPQRMSYKFVLCYQLPGTGIKYNIEESIPV